MAERVQSVVERESVSIEQGCAHLRAISSVALPSTHECEDCVKMGSRWVHLRTCQTCGGTRCCDSSPNRHASKHAPGVGGSHGAQQRQDNPVLRPKRSSRASRHPVIASAEPGERWLYCYVDDDALEY